MTPYDLLWKCSVLTNIYAMVWTKSKLPLRWHVQRLCLVVKLQFELLTFLWPILKHSGCCAVHNTICEMRQTKLILRVSAMTSVCSVAINAFWSRDVTWRHRSELTLAHIMACCLTAASRYLNQCWLIVNEVLWHSPEGYFTRNAEDISPWCEFEY